MSGFTERMSNLPPGCTDREIEEQANPTELPRLLRQIAFHLSVAKGLCPVLLDAIIRAGKDHAGEHRGELLVAAQLASVANSRLSGILSKIRPSEIGEVAWEELLVLAASWKEG